MFHERSRLRARFAVAMLLGFFLARQSTPAQTPPVAVLPSTKSPAEQFKEFLSSPKAAISFKATIRAPETIRMKGTNGQEQASAHLEEGIRHIQCYWSSALFAYSEAFSLPGRTIQRNEVIRDVEAFTSRTVLGSTNESSVNGITITWNGPLTLPVDLENPVAAAYKRAIGRFRTVVNFGLSETEVGTIRWNGDSMAANGHGLSLPLRFNGTLTASDIGRPVRLNLRRTMASGISHYAVQFSDSQLSVGGSERVSLPSQFTFLKIEDKAITNSQIQKILIHEIAFISPADVRREVDKLSLLASRMTNQFVVSGRDLYARLEDGMMVPYARLKGPEPFRISLLAGRYIFWGANIALAVAFAFILIFRRNAPLET